MKRSLKVKSIKSTQIKHQKIDFPQSTKEGVQGAPNLYYEKINTLMFGGFHPMGLFSRGLCMEVLTKGFLSQKRKNPPGTKAPWVKNPLGQNPPIIIIRGFCPTFMFGGFCPKGFCLWGVLSGGFCLRGVLSQGGFVLHPGGPQSQKTCLCHTYTLP